MSTRNFLCLFMNSVKRVFTKSLPRYNLRSRKSAVPVARNSTPKVNREVQASLSEEENCTLSFELPFHPSSLPPTAHVTSSSEEIEPIQSNGLPRFSTAFSEQNPANRTNTEAKLKKWPGWRVRSKRPWTMLLMAIWQPRYIICHVPWTSPTAPY